MGTRRCRYCHRLSPIEAKSCIHCGQAFGVTAPPGARRNVSGRSIPPASPHRAGHYSGLHPEDQPYQSNMVPVARTKTQRRDGRPYEEPTKILLPSAAAAPPPAADIPTRRGKPTARLQSAPEPPRSRTRRRVLPVLLVIVCLLLLAAGSFLSYVFINKRPQAISASPALTASPRQLRVSDTFTLKGRGFGASDTLNFNRDGNIPIADGSGSVLHARADASGAFAVQISITPNWQPGAHQVYAVDQEQLLSVSTTVMVETTLSGPPQLRLSDTALDLGADVPGSTSSEEINLSNSGGGQIAWQASSDQPWLSAAPASGTFSGSQSVTLTANRGGLAPRTYTGHVSFNQQGTKNAAQVLTVKMTVRPAPASLSILPASLVYSASPLQNPPAQTISIQNNGRQPIDWRSAISTGDGAPWLTLSPAAGHLDPGNSATLTVSVFSQQMAVGTYQGTISFSGGSNAQLAVTLNIVAPGNLVTSPPSLNFSTSVGKNPAGQSFTLQNSGGQELSWTLRTSTGSGGNWLSATPGSGDLAPGESTQIRASVSAAGLKIGSYQGLLTFSYGGATKQVAVSLTVGPTPQPAIGVSSRVMIFRTEAGSNPAPQSFTLTNEGNAPLNWRLTEDANWASTPVAPTSGQNLAPGQSVVITISPSVAQKNAGSTVTSILTILDSDPGTPVASEQVTVTIYIT